MYNLLFGKNPNAEILKGMLELGTKYHIGRFRDIYLNKDGTQIIVYTRNGGGNRDCDDCDKNNDREMADCKVDSSGNCFWSVECCPLKGNAAMRLHPNFIEEKDDDYDCTYAYHTFSVPEKYKEIAKALCGEVEPSVTEKFNSLIAEMQTMSKEQMESDTRFKPFVEIIKQISRE